MQAIRQTRGEEMNKVGWIAKWNENRKTPQELADFFRCYVSNDTFNEQLIFSKEPCFAVFRPRGTCSWERGHIVGYIAYEMVKMDGIDFHTPFVIAPK